MSYNDCDAQSCSSWSTCLQISPCFLSLTSSCVFSFFFLFPVHPLGGSVVNRYGYRQGRSTHWLMRLLLLLLSIPPKPYMFACGDGEVYKCMHVCWQVSQTLTRDIFISDLVYGACIFRKFENWECPCIQVIHTSISYVGAYANPYLRSTSANLVKITNQILIFDISEIQCNVHV